MLAIVRVDLLVMADSVVCFPGNSASRHQYSYRRVHLECCAPLRTGYLHSHYFVNLIHMDNGRSWRHRRGLGNMTYKATLQCSGSW